MADDSAVRRPTTIKGLRCSRRSLLLSCVTGTIKIKEIPLVTPETKNGSHFRFYQCSCIGIFLVATLKITTTTLDRYCTTVINNQSFVKTRQQSKECQYARTHACSVYCIAARRSRSSWSLLLTCTCTTLPNHPPSRPFTSSRFRGPP